MSDIEQLQDNIKLYKKSKDEAVERVKKAVQEVAQSRQAQKAQPDRQY